MSSNRYNDPIAEHIAQIIDRARWLEQVDEQHGPNRGRAREHAAMTWAAEELANAYPGTLDAALAIVERKQQHRARRAQNGQNS